MFETVLHWLLPMGDELLQTQATVVAATCLMMTLISIAMIVVWWFSGDLQRETVWAFAVAVGVVAVILYLNSLGYVWQMAVVVIGLLLTGIAYDVYYFGTASMTAAAFVFSVVVSSLIFGGVIGLAIAMLCSIYVVWIAYVERFDWYEPQIPADQFHLTFNAPVLSCIYLGVAILLLF